MKTDVNTALVELIRKEDISQVENLRVLVTSQTLQNPDMQAQLQIRKSEDWKFGTLTSGYSH